MDEEGMMGNLAAELERVLSDRGVISPTALVKARERGDHRPLPNWNSTPTFIGESQVSFPA
jgi:hypothetical protein